MSWQFEETKEKEKQQKQPGTREMSYSSAIGENKQPILKIEKHFWLDASQSTEGTEP